MLSLSHGYQDRTLNAMKKLTWNSIGIKCKHFCLTSSHAFFFRCSSSFLWFNLDGSNIISFLRLYSPLTSNALRVFSSFLEYQANFLSFHLCATTTLLGDHHNVWATVYNTAFGHFKSNCSRIVQTIGCM